MTSRVGCLAHRLKSRLNSLKHTCMHFSLERMSNISHSCTPSKLPCAVVTSVDTAGKDIWEISAFYVLCVSRRAHNFQADHRLTSVKSSNCQVFPTNIWGKKICMVTSLFCLESYKKKSRTSEKQQHDLLEKWKLAQMSSFKFPGCPI